VVRAGVDQGGVLGGRLTVVATPIGNLDELSPRAAQALRDADCILAEDTRRTGKLLRAVSARTRMQSLHEHNELARLDVVLAQLAAGRCLVLVSDAGMPAISDPGYPLIRGVIDAGYELDLVGGPSAVTGALVLSGLPPEPFAFFGFFPRSRGKTAFADRVLAWPDTAVVLISPHRGVKEVGLLAGRAPRRPAALVREISKRHQEVMRLPLSDLVTWLETDAPKGEWTLVVGPRADDADAHDEERHIADLAAALLTDSRTGDTPLRRRVQAAAARHGVPWRKLYKQVLARRKT